MFEIYKNNFKSINDDSITLVIGQCQRELKIDFKSLVRVQFVKKRKLHINYMAVLLSIYLLLFQKNHTLSCSNHLFIFLIIIVLLVVSCIYKNFQYKFLIVKKNYFIEIMVSKDMRKEAEYIANDINKKIAN